MTLPIIVVVAVVVVFTATATEGGRAGCNFCRLNCRKKNAYYYERVLHGPNYINDFYCGTFVFFVFFFR